MTTFETPKSPREFVETMLRSSVEADRLASENIDDHCLREAHHHSAVNGLVAGMALEMLRRFAPTAAESTVGQLDQILTAGDVAGPVYRMARGMGFDPDQWVAEHEERAALRTAVTR